MLQPPPLSPTLAPVPLSPREALHAVAQLGFRFVQLSATQKGLRPRELDRSARRDVLALLRRLELSLSGLDLFIPGAHYIDAAQADRAVDATRAAIELAADLGRVPLTIELPSQLTAPDRDSRAAAIVEAIAQHAERFGVPLANLGGSRHVVGGFGIAVDLTNAHIGEAAVGAASFSRIISARCSGIAPSGARVPLGNGSRIHPLEIQIALAAMGYTRPVVLDARGWADPLAGFAQSAAAWRAAGVLPRHR